MTSLQFWTVNALAVVALVLAIVNISYFQSNREARAQVAERQQFINQTVRLNQLNTEVIKALARAAVETDDRAISGLLEQAGVTYRVNKTAAPMAADDPPADTSR